MKAAALQRLQRFDEARALLTAILDKASQTGGDSARTGRPRSEPEEKQRGAEISSSRAWKRSPNNLRGLLGESRAYLLDNQPDKSVQLDRG